MPSAAHSARRRIWMSTSKPHLVCSCGQELEPDPVVEEGESKKVFAKCKAGHMHLIIQMDFRRIAYDAGTPISRAASRGS